MLLRALEDGGDGARIEEPPLVFIRPGSEAVRDVCTEDACALCIGEQRHELGPLCLAALGRIEQDLVAESAHHLAELDRLRRVSARREVGGGAGVRKADEM